MGSNPKVHDIKAWPKPFQEMREGRKTAEFRLNDRNYSVGEILHIREWKPPTTEKIPGLIRGSDMGEYTGSYIDRKITSLTKGGIFGIPEGYCVMSVVPVEPLTKRKGPNFFAKLVGEHVRIEIQNEAPTPGTIVGFSRYEVLLQEDDTVGPILVMKHSIKCIVPDGNPFEKKEDAKT